MMLRERNCGLQLVCVYVCVCGYGWEERELRGNMSAESGGEHLAMRGSVSWWW